MGRVMVRPGTDHYLADYQEIDILLDTFPYPGGAAAVTALYMGVPVVARMGDHHSARLSASLLAAAGCREWIASGHEEYCQIALHLAADPGRLAALQRELRTVVSQSPLMDRQRYCRDFQQTCLRLWKQKGDNRL